MNILQINTFDSRGGAAKVCVRLKNKIDFSGIKNWLYVKESNKDISNLFTSNTEILQKILNKVFRTEGFGKNTFKEITSLPFWNEVEVIHLHNLHGGYFNLFDLPKISKLKKTVWTLHDPWVLWNESSIPQYKKIFKFRNPVFEHLKRNAINKSEVLFITPSKWLGDLVLKDYPNKNVLVIPNFIDTKIFSGTDKNTARAKLNLPSDKKIILFVANGGLKNNQKGTEYIEQCKENFKDILFLEIGGNRYIDSENELALYYSAADLLLLPSLAENFPLSILESMSCGTPVVAFDTGGINEIIDHKQNGYVAKYKNVSDLVEGIMFIINKNHDNKLSYNARDKITSQFDQEIIFEKYISAYQGLLK